MLTKVMILLILASAIAARPWTEEEKQAGKTTLLILRSATKQWQEAYEKMINEKVPADATYEEGTRFTSNLINLVYAQAERTAPGYNEAASERNAGEKELVRMAKSLSQI